MARRNPPARWVLPDVVDPPDHICFKIPVPNNPYHIAAFRGALLALASAAKWGDDTAHTAKEVAKVWQKIYDQVVATPCVLPCPIFGLGDEGDDMSALAEPYCRDDGSCGYHFRCDICGSWHDVATQDDLAKMTTSPSPATNPPQPAPNGGTQQTCTKLYANSSLPIPFLVSDGDTITLNSASGSWWDGGEFDFGPLWRVPDGDQYVGGFPVGFPKVTGTDPAVAANHMSVIAAVGATPTYFALPVGTEVTISGVGSSNQVFIQVNDTDITNNQGSADICVTVKNNKAGTFTHYFLGGHGKGSLLAPPSTAEGLYSPVDDRVYATLVSSRYYANAEAVCSSTTITRIVATFVQTGSGIPDGARTGITFDVGLTDTRFLAVRDVGTYVVDTGVISEAHTQIWFILSNGTGGTSGYITSIQISGIGPDPF